MPDVTGMTAPRRGTTLAEAGFKTGKVTQVQSAAGPEGTVVSQSPAAGEKAAKGSAVDLEVAGKPAPTATPVAVPDVVGSSQADAEAQLTGAGFTVVVAQAPSDSACRPAAVVSQAPAGRRDRHAGQHGEHRRLHRAPTPTPSTSASP